MQVTMKELRAMIREAIEECGGGRYELEENMGSPPSDQMEESMYEEGSYEELEEAWKELEEAAGLQEAAKKEAAKKEAKKPAKAAEKKEAAKEEEEEEEEKPAKGGMMITKAQLMAALDLNPSQEVDFKRAVNRGHSIADALKAAKTKKK